MNENFSTIRMELDVSRQKVVHQFITHNQEILDHVDSAVKNAIENFDFQTEIKNQVNSLIKSEIQDMIWKGKLRELVKSKMENIVDSLIEKEIAHLK